MTETIFNWILETGLAVTLLIAFILIIRRPFARRFGARWTYALWALPLMRIFMPAIVLPALPDPVVTATVEPVYVMPMTTTGVIGPAEPSLPWSVIILAIWGAGAIVWLGWQMMLQRRFKQTVTQNSLPPSARTAQLAQSLAFRLKIRRMPEIRLSSDKIGPLVTDPLNPVIILPSDFEDNYSAAQQEFALGHELTHIRRNDLWAAFAGLLFRAVNWPNPLVHLAAGKFRADQEAACDASLLSLMGEGGQSKHDYAETLLHAARRTVRLTQPRPLGLTIYHPLKERLMILNTENTKASALSRVLATALIASAIVISAPFTRAEGPDEADTEVTANWVEKKVIKMVEDVDGVETKKHYEIITENGETKAFEIDELGNRFEVDVDSIDGLELHGGHAVMLKNGTIDIKGLDGLDALDGEHANIIIKRHVDGDFPEGMKKRMAIKVDGNFGDMSEEEKQAFIEKLKSEHGGNVFAFSSDEDVTIDVESGGHAWVMGDSQNTHLVTAAKRLTEKAGKSEDLTRDQRRKLEKAIKALEAAQEALEE